MFRNKKIKVKEQDVLYKQTIFNWQQRKLSSRVKNNFPQFFTLLEKGKLLKILNRRHAL